MPHGTFAPETKSGANFFAYAGIRYKMKRKAGYHNRRVRKKAGMANKN